MFKFCLNPPRVCALLRRARQLTAAGGGSGRLVPVEIPGTPRAAPLSGTG